VSKDQRKAEFLKLVASDEGLSTSFLAGDPAVWKKLPKEPLPVVPCGSCPGWWREGETPKHWPGCEKASE
jgi:hypothetical protein